MEVWVDGRRALSVSDSSYRTGAVGMIGYGWYFFRSISVVGEKGLPASWDATKQMPVNSFEVGLSSEEMPSGCIAPNGDISWRPAISWSRSKDKGRSWGLRKHWPEKLGKVTDYGNTMFRTANGRLITLLYSDDRAETQKPTAAISICRIDR